MTTALLLTTANTMEVVQVDNLDDYQRLVGGHIEQITLHRRYGWPAYMIINEDGIRLDLPRNTLASAIATLFTGMTEQLVGDVLIVGDGGEDYGDIPADLLTFFTSSAATSQVHHV